MPPKRKRSSSRRKRRVNRQKKDEDEAEEEEEEQESKRGGKSKGSGGKLRRGKTVEQIYQKKTQTEHILLRPDTYVGSIEMQDEELWVWNSKKSEMEQRSLRYVPALYKIFDEILVNAADNLQRDKKMNTIKVDIDTKKNRIKVWNNGKGIPIQIHKKHKVFVPELVFGHLLTSDNYDDSEKKVTGGRNGFGAKLTNVFSTRFIVETAGGGKKYKQEWTNNMSKKGKPQIKKASGDYTCVEFWPDLKRFGMKSLEEDTVALMQRRVYDVAGTSGGRCKVFLNGKSLGIKSFENYCAYYHEGMGHAFAQVGPRWQVLAARTDGEGFQQCSFVNAISTPKGGTHVMHVLDQLVDAIVAKASKQAKGTDIKRVHVKNNLWLFVNSLIENPAFSSQTKEQMTLKASQFGSSGNLSNNFINEVCSKTGIVDAVIAEAQSKQTLAIDKDIASSSKGKRVLGIPKLEDANEAGGKDWKNCTLILTEGDSAKALVVAGLAVVGRDHYGVFPLRGKLLNVRDVHQKQLSENKEVMNIVKILGLSFGNKSQREMRYGSVMIMADQDYDGSHIKGLLINFFHYHWPALLKDSRKNCFMQEFVTPIVKVAQGDKKITFFTQTEYEKWKKKNKDGKGWKIKYYKGLGTSTAAEAKEYFSQIDDHRLDFHWKGAQDGKLIDMAFNKSRANDRKNWMNKYQEGTYVDHSKAKISYQDFVNKELVQFSRYDLMRSVPSVMDGLKPTQRKVLFCSFKRNLRNDVKVAQFAGYIGEHAAYHHGEASLATTIVGMAHDFVGSNNVNLLIPSGQFGTRAQGGKDAASARYIYTRLNPITRFIFSALDDPVLDYQVEEGQRIEPYWYCPVVPLVLLNGAEGIGTGWSTSVPNYDPFEVIANMRLIVRHKRPKDMNPWYRGFTGSITPTKGERGKYDSLGSFTKTSATILQITELPLRKWTQDYKEFLQSMMPGSEKKTKLHIHDVREYHTDKRVHFVVRMDSQKLKEAEKSEDGINGAFRLKNTVSETNMVLFDHEGKIKKYKNVVEVMQEFGKVRLKMYDIRKKWLVNKLTLEKELLANRARFIALIIAKKLVVNNRKKADVVKDLTRLKFRKFGDTTPPRTGFEYLLIMQILSLTKERKEELEKLLAQKTAELKILKKTTIQQMWIRDLDALEAAFQQFYAGDEDDGKDGKKRGKGDAGKQGKKRKAGDDEGSEDEIDNVELLKRPAAAPRLGKFAKNARRKVLKRPAGFEEDDEEEDEEGETADGEEGDAKEKAAEDDGTGRVSHMGDVGRWTTSLMKASVGFFGKKKFPGM